LANPGMRSRQASAASLFQFLALRTLFMAMSSPLHAQVFKYRDHYAGYNSEVIRYQDAGVSIDEADRAVSSIKKMARQSFTRGVLTDIGSFGACYALSGWKKPVLISSADGVGTKLKVAFLTGRHDTVGEDLVNHCVNDIAVQGASPLFFLDYFAVGKLDADVAATVISGIAGGCRNNGCALIGGETAEMPGMYADGEYDLAGFIVGAAERARVLTGRKITKGDILLGLPSSGLHTNGYSLARKLLFDVAGYRPDTFLPELQCTVGEELLKVHRSYLRPVRKLLEEDILRGAAHITGGGITDNTPRMLPKNFGVQIDLSSWPSLPIFELLQRLGSIPPDDLRRTFNLGIGMILAVSQKDSARAEKILRRMREPFFVIGRVVTRKPRQPRVEYR
jgi:phosphoribosylformylglycinamidine cyclo-ligase